MCVYILMYGHQILYHIMKCKGSFIANKLVITSSLEHTGASLDTQILNARF